MTSEERKHAPVGLRFDTGKTKVNLIPPDALMALGEVYTVGAEKYADRNWEKGMPFSTVEGCLVRHMLKYQMGEDYDEETGCLHLAHVAWNAMALLTYQLRGMDQFDDRQEIPVGKASRSIRGIHRVPEPTTGVGSTQTSGEFESVRPPMGYVIDSTL